ncbi:MAG: Gfo/Idh/MocA family oxidoreductase [Actinobacteria bacterium]|nr:MAG: Gfo/Idh/MocA family oxidoreductase [Actinomycetota bacterium]
MYAVRRIGIVGAGWIAADHAVVLAKREDVEVVAVCDMERTRAEQLAPPGASVYETWEDLLDSEPVDALWVCLPPLHHRGPTVEALGRGVHVYLEKPIARSAEDADAIVAAADQSEAVCAVGYQWHATEVLDDLRSTLDGQSVSLVVGRSIGPTGTRPWFLDRAQGGGNVLERGSHQIDLARVIAGDVVHVQAAASAVLLAQATGERGDIEDAATLVLRHASGALSTIVLAWTSAGQPSTYEVDVAASEATLRLTLDPEFSLAGVSKGEQVEARSREHPFERSIARFLEAARADDPTRVFCTPSDAARTLAVANACEQALATGDTVAV